VSGAGAEAKEAGGSAGNTAREAVGGAVDTARDAGSSVVQIIERNPLPAALIATGLGWLWMNMRQQSTARSYRDRSYTYDATPRYDVSPGYTGRRSYDGIARDQGGALETAKEAVTGAVGTAKEAVDNAVHSTRDAMGSAVDRARDTGSGVVELIERNPLPAALLATSLGWFWMNSRSPSNDRPYPSGRPFLSDLTGQYQSQAGYQGNQPPYGEQGSTGSSVRQTLHQAKDRVGEVTEQVQQQVSELGTRTQEQAHRAAEGVERMLYENPLAVGAIAMTLGAALGMAIPGTRQEQQLMGEARDRLLEKAQQTTQEVAQKVQSVAHEAMDTAKEEARSQGLTS